MHPRVLLRTSRLALISGYYTALERTLFLGEPDPASRAGRPTSPPTSSAFRCWCPAPAAAMSSRSSTPFSPRATFGYGHSFGILSHYYGREAGLELREDIDTVLAPGMVVSMEPMLTVPIGTPGAGGYREHDIVVIGEDGAENITGFPYGPAHNVVPA